MTVEEFSFGFDTLVSSYRRFRDFDDKEPQDTIEFDEYEKSLFLTKAQEEIVISYYNGSNTQGNSFENTEEIRRYLDSLIKTKEYGPEDSITDIGVSDLSIFFELPEDLAFITLEQVTFDPESISCYTGGRINVRPVTQDEYNKLKDNPFRGPTEYKVLRLDSGNKVVELVSKYNIASYIIRYMAKPTPIILENLPNGLEIEGISIKTECMLNSILHNTILERAVQLAIQSKGIGEKK